GIVELWLLSAGLPRQLARDADEQDGKELSEHVLRQGFRQLRAADGRGDRSEADDERGTPANVSVALLAPDADQDRGDDREQRRHLGEQLRGPGPAPGRREERC